MAITRVTDLRTGLTHPVRNDRGQFINKKHAAQEIHRFSLCWILFTADYLAMLASDYLNRS